MGGGGRQEPPQLGLARALGEGCSAGSVSRARWNGLSPPARAPLGRQAPRTRSRMVEGEAVQVGSALPSEQCETENRR